MSLSSSIPALKKKPVLPRKASTPSLISQGKKSPAKATSAQELPASYLSSQEEDEECPSVERGLKDGYTRKTFIIRKDLFEELKAAAFWEQTEIYRMLEKAIEDLVKDKDYPQPKKR